jgi:glycolate dehydrogenase FAD-binding subunit
MSQQRIKINELIERVVGREHVIAEPALQMDDLRSAVLARPGSSEEAAECLRICSEHKLAVAPAGLMTWLDCGNPVARADVVLSLERMNRIIEYSPPDLTATVEAGLALGDFNRTAANNRQWLPFDPPGGRRASLGAIAACSSSGPLRLGFGSPRDYCIGLKLAHANGSQSKSGGKVVKNVAGYDMNKLYVGSYGTLAVITELTFKLRPLPETSVTAAVTARKTGTLAELARQVIASDMQPSSIFIANAPLDDIFGARDEPHSLLLRFADSEAAVKHQANSIIEICGSDYQTVLLSGDAESALWVSIAEIDSAARWAVKISAPLSKALAVYERAQGDAVVAADLGAGTIRIASEGGDEYAVARIKKLRVDAAADGGTLFIERAAAAVKRQVDAWGDVGETASLMRSIKAKFDPQCMLNPGRFVAGI